MSDDMIRSLQNPRVKQLVRLRSARGRRQHGLILIDGLRETARALRCGADVRELYFCRSLLHRDELSELLEQPGAARVELVEVSETVFARICYGDRAAEVVATARRPSIALADVSLGDNPLIVVLEGAEKPGNIGAVIRSADGAGADALVLADSATDVYGPNVIRASIGTIFCLPVVESTAAHAMAWLKDRGTTIITASPAGGSDYTEVNMAGPTAIVLGAEATGLSPAWRGCIPATVPMRGVADSLNVSATAALFLYEARRQRAAPSDGK